LELVYLTFGKRESGIYERLAEIKRPFLKDGGYLTYTQIPNGKISVWIGFPKIEKFLEGDAPKPIEIYPPEEITEDLIINHVTAFLKAMIEWEDIDTTRHELGYNLKSK
jgi:hypothetical protein